MPSRFEVKKHALIWQILEQKLVLQIHLHYIICLWVGARKVYKITEGKILKQPELIALFVKLAKLCHYLSLAVLGESLKRSLHVLRTSAQNKIDTNGRKYSQITQEMPKDRRERIDMFTSTFVLHDFSFSSTRKKIQIPYWNGHVTYGKEYLFYFRWKAYIKPRKHKLKTLHAAQLPKKKYEVETLFLGSEKGLGHEHRLPTEKFTLFYCFYWCCEEDFGLAEDEIIPWQCKQRLIISYYKGMMFPML